MIRSRARDSRLKRLFAWLASSAFLFGLANLLWFALRTGTRPSRAAYPCQRAAAANASVWLAACVVPLFPFARAVDGKRIDRRTIRRSVLAATLVAAVVWFATSAPFGPSDAGVANPAVALLLPESRATAAPASDIFVIRDVTPEDCGVPALIELMAANGIAFYRSASALFACDSDGLIASDDIVLLKVNGQWNQRGGTNTDLLRSLIRAIVDHPDGFSGEIVIADNGQDQYGSAGKGGSFTWTKNNAEDRTQSVQVVADAFAESHAVSTYLWDAITKTEVDEYDAGDMTDGYVLERPIDSRTNAYVCYPKFRTAHGTYVSFKCGVWNPACGAYDDDRLKLINVPILKPHGIYGVTASVKHYMGVTSDKLTRQHGARAHNTIIQGGMGTLMSGARFPDLNILDAIWVSLKPGTGPGVYDRSATRLGIVAASADPAALDFWASKYILMQGAEQAGYSSGPFVPDASRPGASTFARYLNASMEILQEDGFSVTTDEEAMNVFVSGS